MAVDPANEAENLADLRARLHQLEDRVARIERSANLPVQPQVLIAPEEHDPLRIDADRTAATVFTRVAMLSFVLLGALILRVLTQQHILGDSFGTLLGFVYAGLLVVLPLLPGRLGVSARSTSLFPGCGVLLAFVIALESALRTQTLARPTAMVLIAGFSLLALVVAARYQRIFLAAAALLGGILALVGLGLEPQGLALQLSLLMLLSAVTACASWRYAWPYLRSLAFLLILLLLSAGPVLAHKQSMDCIPLSFCAAAFWLIIVFQHLLLFRRLAAAAAWLPLTTLWLALLAVLEQWPALTGLASATAALATLATILAARLHPEATGSLSGLAATAVITGTIGWLQLDASGALCALAGLTLWAAVRRRNHPQPLWSTVAATLLLTAAAIRGVVHLVASTPSAGAMGCGALLTAMLLTYFLWSSRTHTTEVDPVEHGCGALILAAGLLVLFAVLRGIASRLLPEPASFQLSQTGILSLTALLLTYRGHAVNRRSVLYAGLTCMLLALAKIGLIDLRQLNGIHLLSSIVILGLSSVGVSLILRQRSNNA